MSRVATGVALLGVALTVSVGGASHAIAAPGDPGLPVCVELSLAGVDLNQLCGK